MHFHEKCNIPSPLKVRQPQLSAASRGPLHPSGPSPDGMRMLPWRPVIIAVILASSIAYHDPAHKTARSKQQCSVVGASNHNDYPTNTVLPPRWASTFDVTDWVSRYAAALSSKPTTNFNTLRMLKAASMNGTDGFSLPRQFDQRWFDFIQQKLKILEVLETRAGLAALWKPSRSLVDIGGGHGMLGAYLMARHRLDVTVGSDSRITPPHTHRVSLPHHPAPPPVHPHLTRTTRTVCVPTGL